MTDGEGHFSWDEVEVGDDDRTLTLRKIHPPARWSDPSAWFNGGRADVSFGDEGVRVLLWLPECRRGDPGAARQDDPSREVRITLDEPLRGRVPYDGVYGLVEPEGPGKRRSDEQRWNKVQVVDDRTLVVYWFGAAHYPLDRVDVDYGRRAITLTVLEQPAGRLAGGYKAALVRLDEPIAGRKIKDGASAR